MVSCVGIKASTRLSASVSGSLMASRLGQASASPVTWQARGRPTCPSSTPRPRPCSVPSTSARDLGMLWPDKLGGGEAAGLTPALLRVSLLVAAVLHGLAGRVGGLAGQVLQRVGGLLGGVTRLVGGDAGLGGRLRGERPADGLQRLG